jgi:hypothetical protein
MKYQITKTNKKEICTLVVGTQKELKEHLEAMWKFTEWELVAVNVIP